MSKILLVNPYIPMKRYLTQAEQFPNGALLQLGTVLENEGHTVKIIHMMADDISLQQLSEIIKVFKPELVGLTAVTFQSRTLRETAKAVKDVAKSIITVAGGSHISALISMRYPLSEDYPDIDYFVGGEGEFILDEIISKKPTDKIIVTKPMRKLSVLPVNLGLVDIRRFSGAYPPGARPGMFVMGSRGCPYQCTFCSRSVFGNIVRYREPVAVVDDVERLIKNWGIKEVFFQDDTFNVNKEWAKEILNLIIKRRLNEKVCFRTPCRVNEKLLDLDLLKLMKRAGFWLIFYGVESGSQTMLNRMHKGTTTEEIVRAFRLTKEAGLKAEASFIIGLPGETEETIQDSIKLFKEIKPDWCSFTRAIPFPDTELYAETKQSGHLLINSFDDIEVDKVMCRTEVLTGEDIDRYAVQLGNMVSRKKLWQLLINPVKFTVVINDIRRNGGIKQGIKRAWQLI